MKKEFFRMHIKPNHEDIDLHFSKTVIIYDEKGEYSDLGYYDFELCQWIIFGDMSFKMSCWRYVPDASEFIKQNELKLEYHKGYC